MVNLSLVTSEIPYPDRPYGAVEFVIEITVANEGAPSSSAKLRVDARFMSDGNHCWTRHTDAEDNGEVIHSKQTLYVGLDQERRGKCRITFFFQDDEGVRDFPSSSYLEVTVKAEESGSSCRYNFNCDALEKVRIFGSHDRDV